MVKPTKPTKLRQTPLTGIHWYDFIGTDFSFEAFQEQVNQFDHVASEYNGMHTLFNVDDDTPPGKTYSKFYYHKQICQEILERYQITMDLRSFLLHSLCVHFEKDSSNYKAITELYEVNVSNAIIKCLK